MSNHARSYTLRAGNKKLDEALQEIQNVLELTKPEIAFVIAKRDNGPCHLMQPLLVALLGEARPDLEWHDTILHLARLRLPTIDILAYRDSVHLDNPRTGPWVASIDGPALRKAICMIAHLCDVFLIDIKDLLIHGTKSSGPLAQVHPILGEIRKATDLESPRHLFIHAMFGKLSMRASPETLVMDPTGTQYSQLARLVRENVDSVDHRVDQNNPWEVGRASYKLAGYGLIIQARASMAYLPPYPTLLDSSDMDSSDR